MRNLKRNAAVVGASAIIAAIGFGGVMSAQASSTPTPSHSAPVQAETGGESTDASDGPDVGPDANPNEPGHQDADESGDVPGQ